MSFGEYQRRKIEEALRQRTQMGRALGRSQFDLLLNSRIQDELRAASQANKLIQDSIRATGHLPLGNLIDGISIAAREAGEKTISGFNAFAANSLRQSAIEALRGRSFSNANKEAFGDVGRFSSS